MRVIAGSARGRQLQDFKGRSIRPTADRVKEAVFSSLMVRLPGSHVLDLFAGTGALGVEALSRGAGLAVFVENDRKACDLIRANLAACGWKQSLGVRVLQMDAIHWMSSAGARSVRDNEDGRFDIILADPPYFKGYEEKTLELVSGYGFLSPGGVLVLESSARQTLPEQVGSLCMTKSKKYGESMISYYEENGYAV